MNISGGVMDDLSGGERAQIDFSDGEVQKDVSIGGGTINMTGGTINGRIEASGPEAGATEVNIYGGRVGGYLSSSKEAVINVFGGEFIGDLRAYSEPSQPGGGINVFGGMISEELQAIEIGVLTVTGGPFNFPFGDLVPLSGTLSGTLSDGTTINTPFGRSTTARIVLVAESDSDSDGVPDGLDNCPQVPNPDQTDTDNNGVGDACNDGEDQDGDEYADNIDNCPNDFNADQADADLDLIGDVCDPFPDNPDNALAQCEADLTECLENQFFADADNDGEADSTDLCPDTQASTEVDSDGCSLWQFCTAIDTSSNHGLRVCNKSDWKNNEPLKKKGDCKAVRQGKGNSNYNCVPR
jgi:hypothetical protein